MGLAKFVLRTIGFGLSILLYSYLELVDLSPSSGSGLDPSSIIKSNVGMLPVVIGLVAAVGLMFGNGIRNGAYFAFVSLLVLAALQSPGAEDSTHMARYCLAGFIAASAIVFSAPGIMWMDPSGDDKVNFQAYEPQIRQLMYKYNPSELHMVDKMLMGEWKGRGKDLLEHLRKQYTAKKPSKKAVVKPATTAAAHVAPTPTSSAGVGRHADTVISGGTSYSSPENGIHGKAQPTCSSVRNSPPRGSEPLSPPFARVGGPVNGLPSPLFASPYGNMHRGRYGVREDGEEALDSARNQGQQDVKARAEHRAAMIVEHGRMRL